MQEIIRYLTEKERAQTRSLYETCFPEDSREFVDYYYENKIGDNEILIMEEPGTREKEGGHWPQVMLHLNPFLFQAGGRRLWLNYIVAVATAPDARRQGKMFRCMARTLQDLASQKQPFVFLIPANPRVYESSGFAFVPEAVAVPEAALVSEKWEGSGYAVHQVQEREFSELADASNELLTEQYQMFPLWSKEYMKRLDLELRAQKGAMLAVRDETGKLAGLVTYGREEQQAELQHILTRLEHKKNVLAAVREYFFREGVCKVQEAEMPFMVRILNLPEMMKLLGGVCDQPFRLRVKLTDDVIRENNGCFELYCQEGRGGLREISRAAVECELDMAGLAERLFGRFGMYIREWV